MSLLGGCGLSLLVYEPLVRGSKFIDNYTEKVNAYSHEIIANGGFWGCSFSFTAMRDEIESWFKDGLERHIVIKDDNLGITWEGFVNQISVTVGPDSDVRGPIMDLANRVSATYAPKDTSVYPPVIGSETTTIIVDNTTSQALYGIIERIISAGTITEEEVLMARDMYLAQYKDPVISGSMSIGGQGQITATVDCLGYVNFLKVFIYESTTAGYVWLSDKIKAILAADPNNIIDTRTFWIEDNLVLVGASENQNQFGLDIINKLVALGDVNDNRWTFGVYENRIAKYSPIPTSSPDYLFYITDPVQRITGYLSQSMVMPWDIRPSRWIFVPDYYIGNNPRLATPSTLDPRYKFIETVRFTAPNQLELSGGKTDRLSQIFAKLGIGSA